MNRMCKNLGGYLTRARREARTAAALNCTGITLALLVAASAIAYLFRTIGFPETDIVIVYLLAVLLTARATDGYAFGFLASLLAVLSFNFLFVEPYYTFSFNTHSYLTTFVIMIITALVTSTLTTHAKQSAQEAREREAEAKALYMLTNRLTDAANLNDIAGVVTETISSLLNTNAGCLCFDPYGKPEHTYLQQISPQEQARKEITDADALVRRVEALQTGYDAGSEFYDWPIHGRDATLGIIRIPREAAQTMNGAQERMLRAMIKSTALAMDRFRAMQQRMESSEEIARERYRGNLLRAISHDLRTPLAGMMGTAEMLMGMTVREDERYPLLAAIHQDADWLHSLVENILGLTRLQEGKLMLHKQEEAVEEVMDAAVRHIARHHPGREIAVHVPDELLVVPMDAKLIAQVLINLLDNALKHTSPGQEISVKAAKDDRGGCAVFSVCDRGEGIAPVDLPNLFQMFYTSRAGHSDAQSGIGLGLAICEAAVKAHGGNITVRNRSDGPGAEFAFTLPLKEEDHAS